MSHLSRSLKITETDADWSATYDFLLAFTVTMGLSHTVSELQSDISKIFPARGFSLEVCNGGGASKN